MPPGASPRDWALQANAHTGRVVAYCAACDGMRFKADGCRGRRQLRAADALLLSRSAEKVILVHRRDTLRPQNLPSALMELHNDFR
jgi:thioredoxin reductase (NADPH)